MADISYAGRRKARATAGREPAAGFTLLEVMIALAIMVLIIMNVTMVAKTSTEAARNGVFRTRLDDEVNLTLDRISLAVMSSKSDDVYPPTVAPAHTSRVDFAISLGIDENGNEITGDPERIEWEVGNGTPGRVVWSQNPETVGERSVVWSNWVPELFQGEIINAEDDNQNGLFDEGGLAFDMDGDQVNIHLTIERQDPRGMMVPQNLSVNVTCRN